MSLTEPMHSFDNWMEKKGTNTSSYKKGLSDILFQYRYDEYFCENIKWLVLDSSGRICYDTKIYLLLYRLT